MLSCFVSAPEPETKECPFFGNFRVNGFSGMEQSVSEKLNSEENAGKRPYLSSVDIMGTYSDNLSQNFFKTDNRLKREELGESTNPHHDVKHTRRKLTKRDVNYVEFQSNAKLNLSTTYVLSPSLNGTRDGGKRRYLFQGAGRREAPRVSRALRSKRSSENGDKKNSCILNFNKLYFGCRSPDTMEFRSDCPLFSSEFTSGKFFLSVLLRGKMEGYC